LRRGSQEATVYLITANTPSSVRMRSCPPRNDIAAASNMSSTDSTQCLHEE